MPTAPKIIAALLMAVAGWYAINYLADALPDGIAPRFLPLAGAGVAALIGWRVIGARPPRGGLTVINTGVIAGLLSLFWTGFGLACYEMILRSINRRYRGLEDAIEGLFAIMFDTYSTMLRADVLLAILLGGIVAAWVSGAASRRWT